MNGFDRKAAAESRVVWDHVFGVGEGCARGGLCAQHFVLLDGFLLERDETYAAWK